MMRNIRYIFVLTLALLTWDSAWGSTTHYYSKGQAKVSTKGGNTGKGQVYVSGCSNNTPSGQANSNITGWTSTSTLDGQGDFTSQPKNIKYYAYAKANTGYRLLGWSATDGATDLGCGTSQAGNANGADYLSQDIVDASYQKSTTGHTASPYPLYATFGCPQVIGVTHNLDALDLNITNPAGVSFTSKEISFQVKETYEKADFALDKSGTFPDFTIVSETHPVTTALQKSNTRSGDYKVVVSLNSADRHGDQQLVLTLMSNYNGAGTNTNISQSLTINLHVDLTPTFSLSSSEIDFGAVSVGNNLSVQLSDYTTGLSLSAQAKKCAWSLVDAEGTDFTIENGNIKFAPQTSGAQEKTVKIRATYTDNYSNTITHDEEITLKGTGSAAGPAISITPDGESLPVTEYNVPDILGTNLGEFVFDVAEASATPTISFSGTGSELFDYEYNAVTKKLTVKINSDVEPDSDIDYEVTMNVSGGGSPASVIFRGSIKPKAPSTLILLSDPLVIFTNTQNYVPVTGGSGERIYITLDPDPNDFLSTDGETLSGKAVSTSPIHVTITQAASATMKGASLQTDINVIRRTPQITLTPGQVVYPHQSYADFVASDNNETSFTASVTGDATFADNTLAVGAPTSLPAMLTLHVEQLATANYDAVNRDITVYVVKNPAHVPVTMSDGLFNNSVQQNLGGEDRETLLENFVVAFNEVRWTGSEWNGSAYTGTPWTSVGNTNQFTLTATGGSITYHFAGVPDMITFTLAYRSASSTGSLKLEESANGSSWTTVRSYSSPSPISECLKPDTRYLRFTYTGTDICSVQGLNITEANYLRLSEHYVDYMQAVGGSYPEQHVTFAAANWGNVSVEVLSSAFEADVTFDDASRDYDIYSAGSLNIRHVGTGGEAAWIKIKQGERLLDAVRVTALPRYISATTADVIYTSSDLRVNADEATVVSRQRSFEHTFDNGGSPLFDILYVFGVSRNTDDVLVTENGIPYYKLNDATDAAGSNYKIPCYIYTKNGSRYEWSKTIENMNVSNKLADFKLTGANGQKLYFTGTCNYATVGYTSADDGVFHVTGASDKRVDIYLERCSISSRSKMRYGKINGGVGTFDSYYTTDLPQGAGGVFVFECTDTQSAGFSPYVHIRDYNYLKSVEGIPHNSGGDWQWSAAIEVKVSNLNSYTNLTLDDLWPVSATESIHTNGQLDFAVRNKWSRSINIGSANTVLTFNGGYYRFAPINAAATGSSYNNFMPVGYSAFGEKTYGIGEEQIKGTVIINDGTFGLTDAIPSDNSTHTCDDSPYKSNSSHLRFPKNTMVNGGSFLLPLVACGSSTEYPGQTINNRYGDNLVEESIESTGTTDDGVAIITMSEAINQYYIAKGDERGYGMQSIRAKGDGSVTTMLPASVLGVDDLRGYNNYPWVFSAPAMQGQMNAFVKAQVSMNQNAPSGPKDAIQNFLHVEIDNYTREELKNFEPATAAGVKISVTGSDNYSSITNTDDYTIRKALTMMIPIVADHWYTFTAPFDINKVSIMEIVPEDDLVEIADSDIDEALAQQGHAMVDFMAYIVKNVFTGSFTIPMYGTFKFQSKSYTFRQLFDQYKTSVGATIEPLKAYSGPTDWSANYFLYEPSVDGKHRSNYWTLTNGNLNVNWIPAQPETENEQTYVMRRGRTYAMQFPYCPGCRAAIEDQFKKGLIDHGYEEEWDYWTGKYLVLEGDGPQTIWGSNSLRDNELASFNTANQAAFRGNASFGKTTLNHTSYPNLYYHNEVDGEFHDYFRQTGASYIAKPGQGFLLVNGAGGSAPARSYPFQAPTTGAEVNRTTGIPTIGQSEWRSLNPTGEEATKVLINGEVYILRAGKLYTITGMPVY